MHAAAVVVLGFVLATAAAVQAPAEKAPAAKAPARRYGIEPDLETYPQNSPKDVLASALKAIDRGRVDYLLAQLADPTWVDNRIATVDGKFEALVQETSHKLAEDRTAVKELRRLIREGQWEEGEGVATARLKDSERLARFRQLDGRWFFQNDNKDRPPARSP